MRKLLSIPTLLIFINLSSAQDRSSDLHLSLTAALGATREAQSRWYFDVLGSMGSGSPILPGVGLGFGAELGPLYMVQGTMLYSSIEASFGQESAVYQFPGGHIDGGMQRLPIIISAKLISKSQLSPFLKLGLGYAKTDFREISTYSDGHNIRFHKWHPESKIGGGLNYQVSQSTAFEIFVDSWFYGGDLYGRDNYGTRIGLIGGSDLMLFGIRYNYSLQ